MLPSQQRFNTDHAAGFCVILGLVMDDKFIPIKGSAQAVLQFHLLGGAEVHLWSKEKMGTASSLFGAMQRNIAVLD